MSGCVIFRSSKLGHLFLHRLSRSDRERLDPISIQSPALGRISLVRTDLNTQKETGLEDRPDRRSLKGHRRFKTVWFQGRPGCNKEGKWEISGLEAEYVWDVRAWETQACRCGRWSGAPIRPPKQTERFKAMGVWEIFCSLGNLPSVSSQKSLQIYKPDWKTGRRRGQANNFSTTSRLLPMWRMLENVKRDLAELHFRHPKKSKWLRGRPTLSSCMWKW